MEKEDIINAVKEVISQEEMSEEENFEPGLLAIVAFVGVGLLALAIVG
jgi:hypothetical protein